MKGGSSLSTTPRLIIQGNAKLSAWDQPNRWHTARSHDEQAETGISQQGDEVLRQERVHELSKSKGFLNQHSYVSSNPSSIEFSSEKRPSDGIVPNDFKIWVLVHDSRTQAGFWSSKGILVIWDCFWASVGHKIFSARILASISIDVKSYASIDMRSSSRQLPLTRQTDHSSVKREYLLLQDDD
ncbi:hypothetical protein F2Q70_00003056 [Brassica cretica]|uniref:Uncharacterized protein n=1 Tax=Brassica cretica TaxID=69181 RepID=A0A8S9J407_BRACR|nr:hypothetical protein F2Q70_00003056 [Brassica cretica]